MRIEDYPQSKTFAVAHQLLTAAKGQQKFTDWTLVFAPSTPGGFADTYYVVPRDEMDEFLAQWGWPKDLPIQTMKGRI